uniref:Invertebrate defensins family profile domain-containing protein n=1 Tax=Phlebotomus papatasi TaxID=29031 RepID=A0A1B0D9E3_PHLPP
MSIFKVSFFFVLLLGIVLAGPVKENVENSVEESPEYPAPGIQLRVSCDILDPTGWSSTICASHCILQGHKGGYCDSHKVCRCRD